MEHLVYWNCKEKNSALPKQINEFGDGVSLEDICAQLATFYDIVGDMSMERLKELVEADKNGMCIVHPLKTGDEVYVIIFGKVLPFEVTDAIWYSESPTYKAMHGLRLRFVFKADDIGKSVFLTREAAESELAKEVKK